MPDPTTIPRTTGTPRLGVPFPACPPWCQIGATCRAYHYADIAEREEHEGYVAVSVSIVHLDTWGDLGGSEPMVRVDCEGNLGKAEPCPEPCCLNGRPPIGIWPSAELNLSIEQAADLAVVLTAADGEEWRDGVLAAAGACDLSVHQAAELERLLTSSTDPAWLAESIGNGASVLAENGVSR